MSYDRLLKVADVCDRTTLSTATIYRRIAEGTFPAAVRLGAAVRWRESEVATWIADLPRADTQAAEEVASAIDMPAVRRGRGRPRRGAA